MVRTWKDTNPSALRLDSVWWNSAASAAGVLTRYHQIPDPGCRSRQTSLSLALVDQERHIPIWSLYGQLSARASGSHSTWYSIQKGRTPQFSLGSEFYPSLCCLACLEPILACPSLCQAAQTTPLWWGTHLSYLHVILHKATDTVGSDPWGLDKSRCLCARGGALSEPTWWARDEAGTVCVTRRDCRDKWTQRFFSAGVPHGKQGWRFCYCLNNQNSWRQQSSYQYFCRIKIQVSKNGVSLKLGLNKNA